MDVREREAFQLPQSGMHAVYESRVLALRLRLRSQTSLARLSPPPPQSFRDPARLEPWSCFDAVGRTRRTPACLVVFLVFWPLMPAAVFDFLTCRGGGVSVFCLFFFSSLLFSPPRAWRGLAWSGSLLPLFQPILPHHPHRLSPTVFLPRPFQTASTIVAAPLVLRLARLARRGTNKTPILPPRSSAPLFPPLPLVPPLLPSCRLRPRPRPPPCHPGPSFLIKVPHPRR